MTNDPDLLVQRFIEDELTEEEAAAALHRIADTPEARRLLQMEHRVQRTFQQTPRPSVPSSFTEDTLAAWEASVSASHELANETKRTPLLDRLQAAIEPLLRTPLLRVRQAVAVLVLCAVTFAAGLYTADPQPTEHTASTTTTTQTAAPVSESTTTDARVWARFVYPASEATSVAVAGDFNNWEPQALTPRALGDGETVWTALIPVPRGEHEYMFVIDGEEWVTDPYALEQRDDGFGAQNAVLSL